MTNLFRPKVDFAYFDAGGGHRSAATALKSVIEAHGFPWDVRLVNPQEVLDSLDIFKKITGIRLEDIYNLLLANGWTLGSAQGLKLMHAVIRAYHRPIVRMLAEYWSATRPDMVVSVAPNLNRAMYESLRIAVPHVPYTTILTDMADFPPHFWIEPGQDQYFICGTDRAVEQARTLGHPPERILRASGMILRPTFYEPVTVDRAAERTRLGLDPARPTGLVLFGGQGSRVMLDIARGLEDTQLIMICGKNVELAESLRAVSSRAPHFIEGFTQEVPYYMHLADFFIGKPGPGSISEAVAMKLPVIVERNAWTLPQERYNADWVVDRGVGVVLKNFRGIREAVEKLLASLDQYQCAVDKIENRAIFEIPDMLAAILAAARG
ncbi:MAG TPA: glycosyltransferase [Bryobacteraceae bacterium]|nr:glycosyltransferase [Bryobacteraceae bacterium]